jgi:transposase
MKIITDEQKEKIVLLSNAGYTNRQIAIECEIKHATLCYWKRKIRNSGIEIKSQQGRPTGQTGIATINEMKKEGINIRPFSILSEDEQKNEAYKVLNNIIDK